MLSLERGKELVLFLAKLQMIIDTLRRREFPPTGYTWDHGDDDSQKTRRIRIRKRSIDR